jgi:hypothetical protein
MMKYEEIEPMERSDVLRALNSGDTRSLSRALVSAALHDPDRAWIEGLLKRFLAHDDPWVRGIAATCVAHVARLHRALDVATIVPLLERLKSDPSTIGKAQDALDDIEMFVGKPD